jgi:hypothetical protein
MLRIELFPEPDLPISSTFLFFCLRGSEAGDTAGSSCRLRLLICSMAVDSLEELEQLETRHSLGILKVRWFVVLVVSRFAVPSIELSSSLLILQALDFVSGVLVVHFDWFVL